MSEKATPKVGSLSVLSFGSVQGNGTVRTLRRPKYGDGKRTRIRGHVFFHTQTGPEYSREVFSSGDPDAFV